MKSKLKKIYKIYFIPLTILLWGLVIIIAFLSEYHIFLLGKPDKVTEKAVTLTVNTFLMLTATFLGIIVPIAIQRAYYFFDKKRELLFALTASWVELRSTKDKLKNIEENFKDFEQTFEQTNMTVRDKIRLVSLKLTSMETFVNVINLTSYESMVSNSLLTFIPSDELYNSISQAYENIEAFISFFKSINSSFILRNQTLKEMGVALDGTQFERQIIEESLQNLTNLYGELKYSEEKINNALPSIIEYINLHHSEVNLEEELKPENKYSLPRR